MNTLKTTLMLYLLVAPILAYGSQMDAPLSGVWTGKIGTHTITACFNGGEYSRGSGSYYYKRHLQPIQLGLKNVKPENAVAIWLEYDGTWQLESIEAEAIRGIWLSSDQSRKLPIELSKIKYLGNTPVSSTEDCSGDAYNQALEAAVSFSKSEVISVGDFQYRKRIINLRSNMGLESETLELIGDSPAFSAINKFFRKLNSPAELFGCRRNRLGQYGSDGYSGQWANKVSVVRNWLTVTIGHHTDCGFAHPSSWETLYIWNLDAGQPENLLSWFRGGESAQSKFGIGGLYPVNLPLPLAEFVYAHIGQGDPREHLGQEGFQQCYGDLAPDQYNYQLDLFEGGITFIVPITNSGACGEFIKLSFKELAPFLNKKGRAIAETFKQPYKPQQ
jgi:hypothetical protein